MTKTLSCPICENEKVQMISYQPLTLKELPHDKHLYARFQCLQLGCFQIFDATLNISFGDTKNNYKFLG